MGQPRSSRRKVVAVSSDEEDESAAQLDTAERSAHGEPTKPQKQSSGKLKPVKKAYTAPTQTATTSIPDGTFQKSPAKAKVSQTKGKAATKDPPKSNAKPIYSFFNAATQKLRNSQPSASPEKSFTSQEAPEVIHDHTDDDQGPGMQLSKGSSTALALRKRKVQDGASFDANNDLPPQASQKFRKAPGGERIPSFSTLNEDRRPWTDRFSPADLTELAVHKRKVGDVRQWLEMAASGQRQRVLVLKGAAGTGKTSTVKLLAKGIGLDVTEWRNPWGVDLSADGSASTALQFDEFIGRAGRSGGLTFANDTLDIQEDRMKDSGVEQFSERGQLLLIEEFPNTFSRNSTTMQSFRSAIMQYLATPTLKGAKPTPLVMVISETLLSTNTALADSFTAHRLLGPELSNHAFLDTMEFNAVAPTILHKALETIVLKEARKSGRRRTPGPLVLKRLAESGDIRSAISSLEFLCLRGDGGDSWSSKVTFTKQKKQKSDPPLTKAEEEALKLISNRESTLGIFHAVGKVVYNKRVQSTTIEHPPSWLPQHRRNKVPENDIDELFNELGTDTSTFVAALHENYALSCSSASAEETLDSLFECIDSISDADLLSVDRFSFGTRAFSCSATDGLRQDEMAFQVSVRGLWFNLPSPVQRSAPSGVSKRDANQMFYPASLKLWRKREEIEDLLSVIAVKSQTGLGVSIGNAGTHGAMKSTSGVESWKQKSTIDQAAAVEISGPEAGARTGSAKMEMLLEQLPYVAQIESFRDGHSKIAEQLRTVTRVQASTFESDDNEAERDDEPLELEQWATDRPDVEPITRSSRSTTAKKKMKQPMSKLTEGGGLGIPVETSVEKLVLEDDDIVDD